MNNSANKPPAHELVYRRLREMILCGELEPGQAITIQGLVATLGAGMTPVREAIRRLTSESALVFQGNRRVSVPVLTLDQIDELAFARLALEPQLAFWATENVTPKHITRLEAIDSEMNKAIARGEAEEQPDEETEPARPQTQDETEPLAEETETPEAGTGEAESVDVAQESAELLEEQGEQVTEAVEGTPAQSQEALAEAVESDDSSPQEST